jgi:hypothetical protein
MIGYVIIDSLSVESPVAKPVKDVTLLYPMAQAHWINSVVGSLKIWR